MTTLNLYLVFKDNCEEAFNFYKVVFGGVILFMGRYRDVPQGDKKLFPLSADEKIMHASLQIAPNTVIMGCDSIEAYQGLTPGIANNFYLYISTVSQDEAYRIYNELSAGGEATMPIGETFWSTHYGMLADRYGIRWKITFDPDKKQ